MSSQHEYPDINEVIKYLDLDEMIVLDKLRLLWVLSSDLTRILAEDVISILHKPEIVKRAGRRERLMKRLERAFPLLKSKRE